MAQSPSHVRSHLYWGMFWPGWLIGSTPQSMGVVLWDGERPLTVAQGSAKPESSYYMEAAAFLSMNVGKTRQGCHSKQPSLVTMEMSFLHKYGLFLLASQTALTLPIFT